MEMISFLVDDRSYLIQGGNAIRLTFEDIALRDMQESDIEDYVRWFTTETKWNDYDAPWEPIEDQNEESQHTSWREHYDQMENAPEDRIRWKFEIEWNGRHVGWISSYLIDENYECVGEIKEGQTVYRAVGIDICESDAWSHGIGTKALRTFMNYYFDQGCHELYAQTWSGNVCMVRCAQKLRFQECERKIGNREVNGKKYDGPTFRMERKMFPMDYKCQYYI